MAAKLFKSQLHWLRFVLNRRKTAGFTLIELLIAVIISSLVISALLYLVVELLQTNQRESAQTETQRDMEMAMDFISSELREAVYVYGGDCLQGTGVPTALTPNSCPGIANHVPVPANSAPILAFWKLDPLPPSIVAQCNLPIVTTNAPCNAGRTYTLVVYFLRKSQPNDNPKWPGRAQITRYAMTNYESNGDLNAAYVSPTQIESENSFQTWPYQVAQTSIINLRPGLPGGNAVPLVDFVDDTSRSGDSVADADICPATYTVSPPSQILTNGGLPNVRSFYACVKKAPGTGDATGFHQDVLVFLRGNAGGRPGLNNDKFLPTLQAQVLRRGIVNKVPTSLTTDQNP